MVAAFALTDIRSVHTGRRNLDQNFVVAGSGHIALFGDKDVRAAWFLMPMAVMRSGSVITQAPDQFG
jgi:hypothetical protein